MKPGTLAQNENNLDDEARLELNLPKFLDLSNTIFYAKYRAPSWVYREANVGVVQVPSYSKVSFHENLRCNIILLGTAQTLKFDHYLVHSKLSYA